MKSFVSFCIILFIASSSYSQGYKTFESIYFKVGDSIRVDVSLIGDPYFRGWNVRGKDKETLINFLKRNPRLKIQVNAFSDTKGTPEANLERSKLRAASLVEWLIDGEGFEKNRFRHKGWGEQKPLISDEAIYAHRGSERYKWDSLQRINQRIILVIDDIEQKINCAYRSADEIGLRRYYVNDPEVMKIGNRFRLDFVRYAENSDSIIGFEDTKANYEELAAFILCHPGVNFQISVHQNSRFNSQTSNELTQLRAEKLRSMLVEKFTISPSRFSAIGYHTSRPIIPDIIINELAEEAEKQNELHAINRRTELEIISFGAFNDIAFNRRVQLTDLEMAEAGIIYVGYEHDLKLETKSAYDSIQILYNHNELHVSQSKVNSHRWNISLATNNSIEGYSSISFLGWKKGMNQFLTSRSFEIVPIDEPEIYLGDINIEFLDIFIYTDQELFASNHLVARYDTAKYALLKSYPVISFEIKVGKKKFNEQGGRFSADLMRAIRKAKPGTKIQFEHMEVNEDQQEDMHEFHLEYIKKTKTKKNVLFQEGHE